MGTYMWHAGKFPEGQEALGTANDILDDRNIKGDHPLRSNVYEVLGIMSSFEGVSERKYSMDLRHKAHESRHESYGAISQKSVTRDDEIRLYIVESDMAYGLVQEEKFEEASKVMERCLEEYRKWGTEAEIPYEYSKYYQIKAYCLMAEGKPVESIQTIKRCAELLVEASEIMHPMTQLMRFCIGNLSWHAGELNKALEINENVLKARKDTIGDFSHFTLESYSTCAYLLTQTGDYAKARTHLAKCLERRKMAAWNEEGVARAQYRYAQVLEKLGEKKEAERYRLAAKKVRERFMKDYAEYLPQTDDEEAIFDQMVSLWAGRFTGKLKQTKPAFADVPT